MSESTRRRPLEGLRIIEMAGLGPAPFCGMLFADFGAEVIRVDRPVSPMALLADPRRDLMARGKRSISLDLKTEGDRQVLWKLIDSAHALYEGMRPGVMERLGFGPEACLQRKPKLVYGRMTGFGQTGPLAKTAGHDVNYLALSGTLGHIGLQERPIIPLNLVADFGGGAMFLAFGMLSALLNVQLGGGGQVVDAAMVDGAASLATLFHGLAATGQWRMGREENFLDGGAHFYNLYETKDGLWASVGAIEPKFYADLLTALGITDPAYLEYLTPEKWPGFRVEFARRFKEKTRSQWGEIFSKLDACYAPVLTWADAPRHPHNVARGTFVEADGVLQPAPAPRLSATPGSIERAPPSEGQDTNDILAELGLPPRARGESYVSSATVEGVDL